MGRAFVLTTCTDIHHFKEHPYTLTYACEAGSPSHKDVPYGGEEANKISLTYKEDVMASS